jgi:hypothetical protein
MDGTGIPLGLADGHSRLVAVSVRAQQVLVLDTDGVMETRSSLPVAWAPSTALRMMFDADLARRQQSTRNRLA